MMDSVGHYSRPELLSLLINRSAQPWARELVQPERASAPEEPRDGSFTAAVVADADCDHLA
jgi:hypothetical protein